MKRILWILTLVATAASISLAQETQPKPEPKAPEAAETVALPTLDQILDKYIEALGGKDALQKLTTQQTKGTFDIPVMGASGSITGYAKAPNKSAIVIDVPGFGVIQQGFDGTVAWKQDPMSGLVETTGAALAAAKRDATFHRELKLKELYKTIEVKGKEKIEEKDVYVVEATPAEGSAEKLYFDVQSALLVRFDAEREGPQGSAIVQTLFEDYKDVDGVKVPFTIKQTMPAMTIVVKLDEVKQNVEIEDSKFAKPAAQ